MSSSDDKVVKAPDHLELIVIEGPVAEGQTLLPPARFTATSLTIGRTKASRVHIKDAAVSEKHGLLSWNEEGWVLTDCGSSNGTLVNGERLTSSDEGDDSQECGKRLKDGDVIQFGTDTKVRAEISPHASEDITVEQFLEAECHRLIQRVKGRYEQHSNKLQDEWETEHRKQLQDLLVN